MDSNADLLGLIITLLNVRQEFFDSGDWDAAVAEIHSFRDGVANDARSDERKCCAEIAENWNPGERENWENANALIAAAIRAGGEQ